MFLLSDSRTMSGYGSSSSAMSGGMSVILAIIAAVVSLVVAIVLFVTLVQKKEAPKGKFTRWLREYLNFRSILISGIIKFVYIFLATLLTIMSIITMFSGGEQILTTIGVGFAMLVFGNIFLRIMMELTMALIVIWENTSDIRSVIVRKDEMPKPEAPKPEAPKSEAPKPEAPKVTEVPKAPEAPRAPETPRPEAMRTGMPEKSETVVAERREITINGVE